MKTTAFLMTPPVTPLMNPPVPATPAAFQKSLTSNPLPSLSGSGSAAQHETLRHILLGSPEAVRQTIHLLHSLHYAETILWSPVMTVPEELIITPAQGEAMSLLRRQV